MDSSLAIAIGALVTSIASVAISVYFKLKEEARLRTFSSLLPGGDDNEPVIVVAAVNVGRRPMILRMLVGMDDRSEWSGLYLGDDHQGIRLGEGERFERRLTSGDLGVSLEDVEIQFTELYLEDAVGKRWRINDARTHIEKFWAFYSRFSSAQERKRELYSLVNTQVRAALGNNAS